MSRPNSELVSSVEMLQKRANMLRRGVELVDTQWDEIIQAMIDAAVKKKSVMAATWLRDTFIGKPTETIKHEADNDGDERFSGFMVVPVNAKKD